MNDDERRFNQAEFSTFHATSEAETSEQRTLEERGCKLGLQVDDVKVFCRHGFYYEKIPPTNTPARRALLACLKRSEIAPSKWLLISGLYPEFKFSEPDRR